MGELLTMKQVKYRKRYVARDEFDQFTLHIDEGTETVTRKRVEKKVDESSVWYYVGFAGDFGFTIAVPIAGGAFLGMLIDKRLLTYPKMTLSLLLVGIIISVFGFIRIVRDLIKKKK